MAGRKKYKAPTFVMVRKDMLKDPDWQKLSNSAKILWIYMRSKFNPHTLKNGEITLAYSEMKNIIGCKAMSRAFKELIKENWIEKTKKGGLFGGVSSYKFIGKYSSFFWKGFTI